MRALCWNAPGAVSVESVADPGIVAPRDVLVKVLMSSFTGSDLELISGHWPALKPGDVLGHEGIGEIVAIGKQVKRFATGDRIVVSPVLACGLCEQCHRGDFSCCDNSNPKPLPTTAAHGQASAGVIGYGQAFGGYGGSHAEYVRVPFAEINAFKIPDAVRNDQAVFVSDTVATAFHGAEMADIQPGDVVAVWGCGGVGLMTIEIAFLMGAEKVIAIDPMLSRRDVAINRTRASVVDPEGAGDFHDVIIDMTGGRGPDRCIDCVGGQAHGKPEEGWQARAKQWISPHFERGTVLRQAMRACRKGGTVAIPGGYGRTVDAFPVDAIAHKALTLKAGRPHGQHYALKAFEHIRNGELDPSYLLTHPLPLELGAYGYDLFKNRLDDCLRVVFQPDPSRGGTLEAGTSAPLP